VNNGLKYSKQEQYVAAVKEFDLALIISDTSAQVYYFKGMCYFKLKDAEKAIEAFEAAVKRNNKHINSYAKLLVCYKQTKDVKSTIHTYNRMFEVIEDPKKKAELKMLSAKLLLLDDDFSGALSHIEAGLGIEPENVNLLYYKGKLLNTQSNFAGAEDVLNKAVTVLDWRDVKMKTQVYYELGYAMHKQGKYKASLEAFKNANVGPYKSRVAMFTPSFYGKVAFVMTNMHDYMKANEMIDITLAMEPELEAAKELKKKLSALTAPERTAEIEAYKKLLASPNLDEKRKLEIVDKMVDLLMGAKRFDEAVAVCDQLIPKLPTDNELKFMKSMALLQGGKPDAALSILSQLLSAADLSADDKAKYELGQGLCLVAKKDVKKAHQTFKKIIKDNKETAQEYVRAAMFEKNQLDVEDEEEPAEPQPAQQPQATTNGAD
jgi:tetratricopeptide (TPR) repeat protein